MWTSLNRDDLRQARDEMKQRQLDMEALHIEEVKALENKHAEERNSLEAKLTRLNEIEQLVDAFVKEYPQTVRTDGPPEPTGTGVQPATEPAPKPEPVEVEVIATNWGKARFQPAEEIAGVKPARDWGE
jgi:hypothetical protein